MKKFLDEVLRDIAKHVLYRFVFDFGVSNGNGTLEDTDTLWILIENCVDILCLPQRILRGED